MSPSGFTAPANVATELPDVLGVEDDTAGDPVGGEETCGAVITSVAVPADSASVEITCAVFASGEAADAATVTGTVIDGRVSPGSSDTWLLVVQRTSLAPDSSQFQPDPVGVADSVAPAGSGS